MNFLLSPNTPKFMNNQKTHAKKHIWLPMNALGWPFTSICTASCCHTGTLRSVNPGFAFVVACSNCHNTDPLQKTKKWKISAPKDEDGNDTLH
jgi:hypothetical protein